MLAPLALDGRELDSQADAPPSTEEVLRRYLKAKRTVIEAGFASEINWQSSQVLSDVTGESFFREATWVVLNAGMSEAVIRRIFPKVDRALHGFKPWAIAQDTESEERLLAVFAHRRKAAAIVEIASQVYDLGDTALRRALDSDALGFLQSLPYMGPATSRHLAKNLGCRVAKPDRHLIRLASRLYRSGPDELCEEISLLLDDPVQVVDVVLWRWSVLHSADCSTASCRGVPHL